MASKANFNRYFSYTVLVLALILLGASFWFFSEAKSEPIFMLFGTGLVLGSALMLWGVFKTLGESKRDLEIEDASMKHFKKWKKHGDLAPREFAIGNRKIEVLAQWKYTKKEWLKAATVFSRVNKKMELIVAFGILLVCGSTVFFGMEPAFLLAGLFAATLYYFLRIRMISKSLRANSDEMEVIITTEYILYNGFYWHFNNGPRFLQDVEIVNHSEIGNYLLIVIAWRGGKGFVESIDLRVPVPINCSTDLEVLVGRLAAMKKN